MTPAHTFIISILYLIILFCTAIIFAGIGVMRGREMRPKLKKRQGMTIKQIVEREDIPIEKFTCYDCPLSNQCRSAFDPYNTDGDCLEAK